MSIIFFRIKWLGHDGAFIAICLLYMHCVYGVFHLVCILHTIVLCLHTPILDMENWNDVFTYSDNDKQRTLSKDKTFLDSLSGTKNGDWSHLLLFFLLKTGTVQFT